MPRRIVVDFEFKIDETGRNPPRIRCMVAVEACSGQTWTMWEDELNATPVCPSHRSRCSDHLLPGEGRGQLLRRPGLEAAGPGG